MIHRARDHHDRRGAVRASIGGAQPRVAQIAVLRGPPAWLLALRLDVAVDLRRAAVVPAGHGLRAARLSTRRPRPGRLRLALLGVGGCAGERLFGLLERHVEHRAQAGLHRHYHRDRRQHRRHRALVPGDLAGQVQRRLAHHVDRVPGVRLVERRQHLERDQLTTGSKTARDLIDTPHLPRLHRAEHGRCGVVLSDDRPQRLRGLVERHPQPLGDQPQRTGQPTVAHRALLHRLAEVLGAHAHPGLGLQLCPPTRQVDHPLHPHPADVPGRLGQQDRQPVHRKARIHAHRQDHDARAPRLLVEVVRQPVDHLRIGEVLASRHDVRAVRDTLVDGRHDRIDVRRRAHHGDLGPRPGQHVLDAGPDGDPHPPLADDLAEVAACLRRIVVGDPDEPNPSVFEGRPRDLLPDPTEANHSDPNPVRQARHAGKLPRPVHRG